MTRIIVTSGLVLCLLVAWCSASALPPTAFAYGFDQNEDGLDDRADLNRDGKPDLYYVLPRAPIGPMPVVAYHQPTLYHHQPVVSHVYRSPVAVVG